MCLDWIGIAFNTCLHLVFNRKFQESNHIWGWVLEVLIFYFNDENVPNAAVSSPNLYFKIDPLDLNHMQCEGLFQKVFESFMNGLKKIQNEPIIYNNNETMHLIPFFTVNHILITSIIIFIYTKIIQFFYNQVYGGHGGGYNQGYGGHGGYGGGYNLGYGGHGWYG